VNRLEALADAISHYSGYRDPSHPSYANRNPGRLRKFLVHQKADLEGMRVFDKHVDGYTALLFDLEVKCSGKSRTGLKGESPLKELLYTLDFGEESIRYPVSFLRKALQVEDLNADTPLMFFLNTEL